MANSFKGNPIIVDTAAATPIRPSGSAPLTVSSIVFSGYTTGAADSAVLQRGDKAGSGTLRTFITLQGRADKTHVELDFAQPIQLWDLTVSTLSSGIVSIFLAGSN